MDSRITSLTPWQRIVYTFCWSAALGNDRTTAELGRMKKERPEEYEKAFEVWTEIMYEVMY